MFGFIFFIPTPLVTVVSLCQHRALDREGKQLCTKGGPWGVTQTLASEHYAVALHLHLLHCRWVFDQLDGCRQQNQRLLLIGKVCFRVSHTRQWGCPMYQKKSDQQTCKKTRLKLLSPGPVPRRWGLSLTDFKRGRCIAL